MKKMMKIGTELELEELNYVHGGQIIYDPRRPGYPTTKQLEDAGKAIYAAGKEIVKLAQSAWHAISSWF